MNLTKQQAVAIFGTGAALARALGLTKGAIPQWPDELDTQRTAAVIGAAVQHGFADRIPAGFIPDAENSNPADAQIPA
ncbi:TPA: Cro/CI family transcriptional regulator [Burkholderia cenocepacia]